MTTGRLFQGKGFNSIHKDIYFFSFKVQLTYNIKNIENFHTVMKQAEMCTDIGVHNLWLGCILCVPFSSATKMKTPLRQLLL